MPYCFEFTFTFILVNKKIKKWAGSGEGGKRRNDPSQHLLDCA